MKQIKRVAVLGAGVMGANIAAHLANAGLKVLLLDVVPKELTDDELARGLTQASQSVRNRYALSGVDGAVKGKGLYLNEYAALIETGNFDDHMEKIGRCDWVIEVVVENLAVKTEFLTGKVVPYLSPGAILSTNTSGLSVNELAKVLPEELRRNFLVTHFFNPPRFMHLVEIIPCCDCDPLVVTALSDFISRRLGKGIVNGKDTPNFIANRIGVYSMFNAMKHMVDLGMTVEEVDAVGGAATARAASAIFRTADLVGIDTLSHVGKNSYSAQLDDEEREMFSVPTFVAAMIDGGLLGNKSKCGFFRKEKDGSISFYDYLSGTYKPSEKPGFESVVMAIKLADPAERLRAVVTGSDRGAEFAWRNLRDTLIYSVNRIPEISDDAVNIDNGMKWGFNWELGPFEMLDAIGVEYFVKRATADGVKVPAALLESTAFYTYHGNTLHAYNPSTSISIEVQQRSGEISFYKHRRDGSVVANNCDASLHDLGDGVLALEFHSKMNAITMNTIAMLREAVERSERDAVGLLIGNQGKIFSAGANLQLVAQAIEINDFASIERLVREFQSALMGLKYSVVPVVAAPFGLTLGGGCEVVLHADAVNAHSETAMGLVEIGVGLLPAGGGTKEMALRAIRNAAVAKTDVSPYIAKYFQQIVMARLSGSAAELEGMGYMRRGDVVSMNIDNLIADAKQKVLTMALTYRPAQAVTGIPAPGRGVAAALKNQIWNMQAGGFVTGYEVELADTIADVICGGDVPAGTVISEEYMLELECEAFLKLCGNKKTVERINFMMKTGKVLRN